MLKRIRYSKLAEVDKKLSNRWETDANLYNYLIQPHLLFLSNKIKLYIEKPVFNIFIC